MPSFIDLSDYSSCTFGDGASDFGSLRSSALRKASQISSLVEGVTIGPNSICENKIWNENVENVENNRNLNVSENNSTSPIIEQNFLFRNGRRFSEKKEQVEKELARREQVVKLVEGKKQDMEKISKNLRSVAAMLAEIRVNELERERAAVLAKTEAEEQELMQQRERKMYHEAQLHAQKKQERKERFAREAELHVMKEREKIIQRIRDNFRERYRDLGALSNSCKDKNSVAQMLGPYMQKFEELTHQMEIINEKARRGELSAADVQFAETLARQGEDAMNEFASEIARINATHEEEKARREHESRQAEANAQIANARLQQSVIQANNVVGPMEQMSKTGLEIIQPVGKLPETPPNEVAANVIETGATTTDSSSVETVIDEYDQQAFQIYQSARDLLSQYTASPAFIQFRKATEIKKFRFECQKAINQPLNTIAVVNGSHLTEKYNKLHQLLSGQSSLNVYQHPQGPIYCKNLLAEKIVNQGETLVSSKPESAFGIAAVTVALMSEFPDFADLLKAHFYLTCPYLVPFFPPRLQGQTDENYYMTLGYKYIDGVVEKETKFLTRMSGIMRLYAAIIVAHQRRNITTARPLGLPTAWRWLAATINYEVTPKFADICATLIFDMLEVVGNALWTAYPRQCPKLLILLRQHYCPLIQNCGGVGGGPATRLGTFLNDCIARNFIPPPNGQLPPNFW